MSQYPKHPDESADPAPRFATRDPRAGVPARHILMHGDTLTPLWRHPGFLRVYLASR
jgi:hypothetical protein